MHLSNNNVLVNLVVQVFLWDPRTDYKYGAVYLYSRRIGVHVLVPVRNHFLHSSFLSFTPQPASSTLKFETPLVSSVKSIIAFSLDLFFYLYHLLAPRWRIVLYLTTTTTSCQQQSTSPRHVNARRHVTSDIR